MSTLVSIPIEADQKEAHAEVRSFYLFPDDPSVEGFLADKAHLPQLLVQAARHLGHYFPNTAFALRVSSDDHGWETLYVDALWTGSAEKAVAALDAFEDAWWIGNSSAAHGDLTFTYRLI